jgi:hypothetical protein
MRNAIITTVLALGFTIAATNTGTAQAAGTGMVDNIRAEELHSQAQKLFESPKRYTEAAGLLRKAASLRSPSDPAGFDELVLSARLYLYAGKTGTSRVVMEQAAQWALAMGQVSKAADAYVNVAFIALRQKRVSDAKQFAARAEQLAQSPYLSVADRQTILNRINPAKVAIADAGN